MERVDNSIQDSILTTTQRKFLQSNIENTNQSTTTRSRIRERVREGLADFRLLADHLEERDRDTVFEGKPGTQEYAELQGDVQAAIEFLYVGVGGESGFRQPLRQGVANGEKQLGNVESAFHLNPQFTVDHHAHGSTREALEAIENEQWDRLNHKDLFLFVKRAVLCGAIDFEQVRTHPVWGIKGDEVTEKLQERNEQRD